MQKFLNYFRAMKYICDASEVPKGIRIAAQDGARRALALDEHVLAVTQLTAPRGFGGAVPLFYECFL